MGARQGLKYGMAPVSFEVVQTCALKWVLSWDRFRCLVLITEESFWMLSTMEILFLEAFILRSETI